MTTVYLNLSLDEIVYDIQNKTYLTGKSRREGDNHELVAAMQANDDEENANQILRSVGNAFAMLKTRLGEYLDLTETTADNILLSSSTGLALALRMPSNFNLSTTETLAAAAHQYIVAMAVGEWFTITHKTDAADYAKIAEQSLKAIAEAANKRVRPRRKTSKDE